jgi:hypothetical protein
MSRAEFELLQEANEAVPGLGDDRPCVDCPLWCRELLQRVGGISPGRPPSGVAEAAPASAVVGLRVND